MMAGGIMTKKQLRTATEILKRMDKANQVEPTYPVFIPIEDQEAARAALNKAKHPVTIFDGMAIFDIRDLMRLDPRMN